MISSNWDGITRNIDWPGRFKTVLDPRQYPITKLVLIACLLAMISAGMQGQVIPLVIVPVVAALLFFTKESSAILTDFVTKWRKASQDAREKALMQAVQSPPKPPDTYATLAMSAGRVALGWFIAFVAIIVMFSDTKLSAITKADVLLLVGIPIAIGLVVGLENLSRLAAKRGEFPLLAAPSIAGDGAILGGIVGTIGFVLWHWWQQDIHADAEIAPAFQRWLIAGATLGGVGNLWRRFSDASFRDAVQSAVLAANRLYLIAMGMLWGFIGVVVWALGPAAVDMLTPLVFATEYNAMLKVAVQVGAVCLGLIKGAGPILSALTWSKGLESEGGHGEARAATPTEAKAAARGGGAKPTWAEHGYRD